MCSYFDTQGAESLGMYARITGCWHHLYEFYAWSNVVCIKRGNKLYQHFEDNSI